MKQNGKVKDKFKDRSHPTWVRGLKPGKRQCFFFLVGVAPYVGAWIETP